MSQVFADTYFWIALLNDKDQGHAAAQAVSQSLGQATIVTTQEVLSEVQTQFSGYGRFILGLANFSITGKTLEQERHGSLNARRHGSVAAGRGRLDSLPMGHRFQLSQTTL